MPETPPADHSPQSASQVTTTGEFKLNSAYRADLNRIAEPRYQALRSYHEEKATALTEELFDSPWGVGRGSGRTVFPLPETAYTGGRYDSYVVKLADSAAGEPAWDGPAQNTYETYVWNKMLASDGIGRSFLAPVVESDSDGYWLIMPRGDCDVPETRELWNWLDSANAYLDEFVWHCDIALENTVKIGDAYQICDYGIPPEAMPDYTHN